jgi:hypothetical protein
MSKTVEEFRAFVDEQATYLKPTLRLFLSADLVNSTALKQKLVSLDDKSKEGREKFSPWLSHISEFYRTFPITLANEWQRFFSVLSNNVAEAKDWPPPRLWKANGDELIYVVELSASQQVSSILFAWVRTLKSFRRKLLESKNGLDLKSAAWVAGFPMANAEILFEENPSLSDVSQVDALAHQDYLARKFYEEKNTAGIVRDYVGPSVDTGFRLGGLASPRKLILSFELAYILATIGPPKLSNELRKELYDFTPSYYSDGRVSLKGVFNGIPYPIFWLDVDLEANKQANRLEDQMISRSPVTADVIEKYFDTFVDTYQTRLAQPFILGDTTIGSPADADYIDSYIKHVERVKKQIQNAAADSNAPIELNGETSSGERSKKEYDEFTSTLIWKPESGNQ